MTAESPPPEAANDLFIEEAEDAETTGADETDAVAALRQLFREGGGEG